MSVPRPSQSIFKAQWKKSSYTGNQGNCVEVAINWRKSSYSGRNGDCVEVGAHPAAVLHGIRDSKNPDAAALFLPSSEWAAFVTAAREHRL